MRDEAMWRQITTAPTALENQEFGLESVVTQQMHQKFKLNPDRCSIALYEYRRFRYLCSVSYETLKPPPLLRFVQARDTVNSVAHNEGKWWQIWSVRDASCETLPFDRDPAYQRALDLYQEEFGLEAPSKIWPSPLMMRRRSLALLPMFVGFGMALYGAWVEVFWIMGIGFALFMLALVYLRLHLHWADPTGD